MSVSIRPKEEKRYLASRTPLSSGEARRQLGKKQVKHQIVLDEASTSDDIFTTPHEIKEKNKTQFFVELTLS